MATVIIRIAVDDFLLCDSRRAEVGDSVDLYLDEVKFPAASPNPIRGVISDFICPEAGDPESAKSILFVDVTDTDLPVGLSTLECCDLAKIACADCCLRNQERLFDIEGHAVYFLEDPDELWSHVTLPSTIDPLANDSLPSMVVDTALVGMMYLWRPESQKWQPLAGYNGWDASLGDPPAELKSEGHRLFFSGSQGAIDGTLFYPLDTAIYIKTDPIGGVWTKIGHRGEYDATGVKLSGTQTITGDKTFTGEVTLDGTVEGNPSVFNITTGTGGQMLGGVWSFGGDTVTAEGDWQANDDWTFDPGGSITALGIANFVGITTELGSPTTTFNGAAVTMVSGTTFTVNSDVVEFTGDSNTFSGAAVNFTGTDVGFTSVSNPVEFNDVKVLGNLEQTGSEIGFYGETPVVQASHIVDASVAHALDASAPLIDETEAALNVLGTKINSILLALENIGVTADS